MHKKILSTLLFITIFVSSFSIILSIQNVNAIGPIYIRSDGTIDPPTAPIRLVENSIIITGDIYESIIVDQLDRFFSLIDGRGHTIQGTGQEVGLLLQECFRLEIYDLTIQGFEDGMQLIDCNEISIVQNNITGNLEDGISLQGTTNRTRIYGNFIIENGGDGIDLHFSTETVGTVIFENNITRNGDSGIDLDNFATNCRIYNNNFIDNEEQIEDIGTAHNQWDGGYAKGGNYWSDYTDIFPANDTLSGPNQNQDGSDGYWDHPYIILFDPIERSDKYPLTTPLSIIKKARTEITCTVKTIPGQKLVAYVNEKIEILGFLQPRMSGIPITLTIYSVTSIDIPLITDEHGNYFYSQNFTEAGSYIVQASWNGNAIYRGATSAYDYFDVIENVTSNCLIATATFGSELSPEVQFLRGFRDNTVLSTHTGRQFIEVFNGVYYSFSPGVASAIRENAISQDLMQDLLTPLMGILHTGQSVTSIFSFNPDFRIIMFCLVVSSLIGLVYLLPLNLLINILTKTIVPVFIIRVTGILWIGSVVAIFIAEIVKVNVLLMVSGGTFVVFTAVLTTLFLTRIINKLSLKVRYYHGSK